MPKTKVLSLKPEVIPEEVEAETKAEEEAEEDQEEEDIKQKAYVSRESVNC